MFSVGACFGGIVFFLLYQACGLSKNLKFPVGLCICIDLKLVRSRCASP